jgi:MFS family permease
LGTALSNFVGGVLLSGPMAQMEQWHWRWLGFDMGRYDYLFILSTLLRMVCVLLLLPRLREPEDTPATAMVRELSRGFAQRAQRYRHALWASRKRNQNRRRHRKEE